MDDDWQIPDYLVNVYHVWSQLGEALRFVASAHVYAHHKALPTDPDLPEDTVLAAVLDVPVMIVEEEPPEPVHDLIIGAQNALHLVLTAMVDHLDDMQALPPWWDDMMREANEEDDEG